MKPGYKILKQYLTEAVKVTIQQLDDSGKQLKDSIVQTLKINDDDVDELQNFLDRYSRRDVVFDPKGRKKDKEAAAEATKNVFMSAIDELITLDPGEVSYSREELYDVVRQWDDAGLDALKRIVFATRRTGRSFPFLAYKDIQQGTSIKFPQEPTSRTVKEILNYEAKNVGKGELLLSLLTGAKRTSAAGMDLVISGTTWQVKDLRSNPTPRLGDAATPEFDAAFEKELAALIAAAQKAGTESTDLVGILDSNGEILPLQKIIDSLRFYTVERSQAIYDALDAATRKALHDVGGFILVADDAFEAIGPADVYFQSRSKSARISIDIPRISGRFPRRVSKG